MRTINRLLILCTALWSASAHAELPTLTIRNINAREVLTDFHLFSQDPEHPERIWIDENARKQINHLLRDWRTGKETQIEERLLWHIQEIADYYQKPILVSSSFRMKDGPTSRHRQGRALDFRIDGVANHDLWELGKRFHRVGVGYYTHVDFIHFDTRDRDYYWIDDSGPGQEAKYRKNVSQKKPTKRRTFKVEPADHGPLIQKVSEFAQQSREAYQKAKSAKAKAQSKKVKPQPQK